MRPEGKLSGLLKKGHGIHSNGQSVFSLPHIEGITLGVDCAWKEQVDRIVGGGLVATYSSLTHIEGITLGVDCNWKGQVVRIVGGGLVATYSSLPHIEGITLGWIATARGKLTGLLKEVW